MFKKIIYFFQKKKAFSIILIMIILLIMWYCSSIPGGSLEEVTFNWMPTAYHLIIFFLFSFFLLMIITKDKIEIKSLLITIIFSLIIAVLDEFHQSFVPGRDSGIRDILIDLTGAIISSIVVSIPKYNNPFT